MGLSLASIDPIEIPAAVVSQTQGSRQMHRLPYSNNYEELRAVLQAVQMGGGDLEAGN